jgi:hypothetical protein
MLPQRLETRLVNSGDISGSGTLLCENSGDPETVNEWVSERDVGYWPTADMIE